MNSDHLLARRRIVVTSQHVMWHRAGAMRWKLETFQMDVGRHARTGEHNAVSTSYCKTNENMTKIKKRFAKHNGLLLAL